MIAPPVPKTLVGRSQRAEEIRRSERAVAAARALQLRVHRLLATAEVPAPPSRNLREILDDPPKKATGGIATRIGSYLSIGTFPASDY
jgi:hypothetical protein